MYKNSSHNQQSRTDRTILVGHLNGHGVDDTVWADAPQKERVRLVQQKKELESKLFDVNKRIAESVSRHKGFKPGTSVPHAVFKQWQADQKRFKQAIVDIERRISQLKLAAQEITHEQTAEREKRFERMFMRMAKELLAEPIYDRIVNATIHRIADSLETQQS